ncbi:MAG: hypothetical protein HN337_05145 [Deltaproteobacteria bacterium]|jgi:hypothetical protein|nr:hypothetical protein [Deltaproteobacteria bacterium]
MSKFIDKKPATILWAISLIGAVLAVGLTKLANNDIWWQLGAGKFISNTLTIPRYDIFSYTAGSAKWVNPEWLFQVFIWNLFDLTGPACFTIIKLIATAFVALTLFKTTDLLVRNKNTAMWSAFMVLIAFSDRIMVRPHLFSIMMVPFFCLQLHKFRLDGRRLPWELPLLSVIWINMHGGAIMAPLIVAAFAAGETIQYLTARWVKEISHTSILRRKIISLWITVLLCIVACCITPHGIELILFPFQVSDLSSILRFTNEWGSVFEPRMDRVTTQIVLRIILVILMISYFVGRKHVRFSYLMLSILTSYLLLKGRRFSSYFVIINMPIIFYNFKGLASRMKMDPMKSNGRAYVSILIVTTLSVVFLKYGIPATIDGGRVGHPGIGMTQEGNIPAVQFIIDNNIRGRIYNEMEVGGHLMYARGPEEKVFIDGRTALYGDEFFMDYINSMRNRRFFQELDHRYEFDYILMGGISAWRRRHMHRYLWEDPQWKLVYGARDGFVYVRDIEKFGRLTTLKIHPLIEEMRHGDMNKVNIKY